MALFAECVCASRHDGYKLALAQPAQQARSRTYVAAKWSSASGTSSSSRTSPAFKKPGAGSGGLCAALAVLPPPAAAHDVIDVEANAWKQARS